MNKACQNFEIIMYNMFTNILILFQILNIINTKIFYIHGYLKINKRCYSYYKIEYIILRSIKCENI